MIGSYFRAAGIFFVAAILNILLNELGSPLLDVASKGSLPAEASPLVTWGQYFLDYFLIAVLLSLLIYLLVAAWRENKATGGI